MDPPRKTGREADWTRTHAQKITEAQESMRLVSLVAPAAVGCSPSPHLLVSGAPKRHLLDHQTKKPTVLYVSDLFQDQSAVALSQYHQPI